MRRILFICGSLNQTTQLHEISRHLGEFHHAFTPYYADGVLELARRSGLCEFTILGEKLRRRSVAYLEARGLPIDLGGASGDYDLVVTCSDLVVPQNIRGKRIVLVQEGILDPPGRALALCKRFPSLPLWLAGTASTGLSGYYERFCVASEGYRDHFVSQGVPAERIAVTGIPNFDDCERYRKNEFPYRHYVLVCTSDARETFKLDDRSRFLDEVSKIAGRRLVLFKLHPNENKGRATREIRQHLPGAIVFSDGSAEEMIANCDVLITQYSSTVFVGLALGKEVHSYFDLASLKRLLPLQTGRAARDIAAVCREVIEAQEAEIEVASEPPLGIPSEACP